MSESTSEVLLAKYLQFCQNPLRDDTVVTEEFSQLCSLPYIQAVGFYNPFTLMLGTVNVAIQSYTSGHKHDVGEFIIYIIRGRQERAWWVSLRFENITRRKEGLHHPHIREESQALLSEKKGELCIQKGRFTVSQHIRKGEIHLAAPLLWGILNTYNPQFPFRYLEDWPESEQNG